MAQSSKAIHENIPTLKKGDALSATVAAPTAQTSAASAASPTKTEFDKTVVDLASLYTYCNAMRTALRNAGIVA